MNKLILVGIGGFIGATLRYLLSAYVQNMTQNAIFPYGTFAVNMIGCFLIGMGAYLVETQSGMTSEMRLLLLVGLLGSFTTYSTYSSETVTLLQGQRVLLALVNSVAHLVIGLSAVVLGRLTMGVLWK
jgi:fluoride exporter